MPPVINRVTSILGFPQWITWSYQMNATALAHEAIERAPGDSIFEVDLASTAGLSPSPTYSNGTAGVGATLTGSTNAALTVDSVAVTVGQTLLVRHQTSTAVVQNGLYVVTQQGDGSTVPYILTRLTTHDAIADFVGFFRARIGTVNTGNYYFIKTPPTAMGTSAIDLQEWTNRWKVNGLPAGMAVNPATGKISGAATEPGIFNCVAVASGDKWSNASAALEFSIAIESGPDDVHSGIGVSIDLNTGAVEINGGGEFYFKRGDQRILHCRFRSQGIVVDLGDLPKFRLGIKEFDPDPLITIGGGESTDTAPKTIAKVGTGSGTKYLMYVAFTDTKLAEALANYEADAGTEFAVKMEFEWLEPNEEDLCGPENLTRSSQTFVGRAVKDQLTT